MDPRRVRLASQLMAQPIGQVCQRLAHAPPKRERFLLHINSRHQIATLQIHLQLGQLRLVVLTPRTTLVELRDLIIRQPSHLLPQLPRITWLDRIRLIHLGRVVLQRVLPPQL